jgi:two-component system CheB/CheR fusion protein
VFQKVPRGDRDRLRFAAGRVADGEPAERYAEIRDGAADMAPVASLAVDRGGFVASINQAARTLFNLGTTDVGRPLQDLEVSYRPIELRAGLQQAWDHRRVVNLGRTRFRGPRDARVLEVEITPLFADGTRMLGASLTFDDVTAQASLEEEFRESKKQLESAYEELQSTVEELETTNEELQSTNEELETTNEELQSTNEELETMNEELQSTNDELEAMNEEQRERTTEVDRLNLFLEGILGNLGIGVVVLDRDQRIQLWNPSAAELWGLREEEVTGEHFVSLDIGLPVSSLRDAIRSALKPDGEAASLTLEAVNRRGRQFECHIRALPLVTATGDNFGVILLMSDDDGKVLDTGPSPDAAG